MAHWHAYWYLYFASDRNRAGHNRGRSVKRTDYAALASNTNTYYRLAASSLAYERNIAVIIRARKMQLVCYISKGAYNELALRRDASEDE